MQQTPINPRTGGQILVDGLIGFGVKKVFCVPGESYLAALDAFHDKQEEVQLIVCRQEGGAAYMAEAWGKLTGEPGVCFVTRGPGASNAMIGVHTAFQDSTPMLLFIGQVGRDHRGREAFQELDYSQVYSNVAKAVIEIDSAERMPELLAQAYNLSLSGRPGPVVIVLPEDMLRESAQVQDMARPIPAKSGPRLEDMNRFADLLKNSDKPLIICGGAGWSQAASKHLTAFSERQNLPVICAFRRQDTFDNTHINYIGELGIAPNPKLVERIQAADLVIAVGPRLGEMTTSGYSVFDLPMATQKLVHVHASADEINKVYRTELAIASDPAEFFLAALKIDTSQPESRTVSIAEARNEYAEFMNAPRNEGAALRMDRVAEFLRNRLPANSVITNGAGNFTSWGQRHYQFRSYPSQLAPTNGSMGYGVPAGIAAKIAEPDRTVIIIAGDGDFLMNGQELATAVQYGANIIILLVNNSSYGTIRSHQEKHYPNRPSGTALRNPDFAAFAESFGAHGDSISRTQDFAAAFERAVSSSKPAIIELVTDY